MRRSIPLLSSCLLGLVTSITLLSISQLAPMSTVEVALGSGADVGSPAATTDRVEIDQVATSRIPRRRGDERSGLIRHDDATVRPLTNLSLLTAPTAAGASLVADRLTYTPGATRSVRRHTRIHVVSLEAGTLDARLDGVAFLDRRWPAGSLLASEPHRVEGVVHLSPGDVLVVPAEAAFTAHNPGELPAISLEVSVQLPVPLTPMTDQIGKLSDTGDVRSERLAATIVMASGISAEVAVGRVILAPGRSIVADRTTGPSLFVVERGRVGAARAELEVERAPGEVELVPQGALATIHNTDEAQLAVLLLTINPAESGPSAE